MIGALRASENESASETDAARSLFRLRSTLVQQDIANLLSAVPSADEAALMAVRIEVIDETLRPGVPQPLFATGLSTMPLPLRSFNVSLDGQRFLMAMPEPSTGSSSLVVVSNWPAVLKRRD